VAVSARCDRPEPGGAPPAGGVPLSADAVTQATSAIRRSGLCAAH
jgi:hypothetical protein